MKLGPEAALKMAAEASKVVVVRGKRAVVFSMTSDPPDRKTLLSHLLGRTGNLRAPALRVGGTLLVGFHEEAYREVFG